MRNNVVKTVSKLGQQIRLIIVGLLLLELILKIKTHTQVVMQGVLDALNAKDADYRAGRDALTNAQAELDRVVAQAAEFLANMMAPFSMYFGRKWNPSWQQVGITGPTLAVPLTHPTRQNALRLVAVYLAGHTAAEIPSQGLTKVAAQALFDAYADTLANVQTCRSDLGEKRAALDAACDEAALQVRGFIKELWSLLSDTDSRWRSFGLNPPGWPEVPDQVRNLVVTLPGLAGVLLLAWDTAARAARYQVEMQLMAPDAEWTLVTTTGETSVTLTELTPGANVLLRIVAANDGGEGVPSEPVQAQVPVALAA